MTDRKRSLAVLIAFSLTAASVAAVAAARSNPKVAGRLSGLHCSWICIGHPDRSITGKPPRQHAKPTVTS